MGEALYPTDQITDYYERQIAADLIREAALEILREEVPHAMAVRIDDYKERRENGAFIAATLFVEKESQKGIVIGKGGKSLKQIGTQARQEIERMLQPMLEAASAYNRKHGTRAVVAAIKGRYDYEAAVNAIGDSSISIAYDRSREVVTDSSMVVCSSGTATLETAIIGTTFFSARTRLSTKWRS